MKTNQQKLEVTVKLLDEAGNQLARAHVDGNELWLQFNDELDFIRFGSLADGVLLADAIITAITKARGSE